MKFKSTNNSIFLQTKTKHISTKPIIWLIALKEEITKVVISFTYKKANDY